MMKFNSYHTVIHNIIVQGGYVLFTLVGLLAVLTQVLVLKDEKDSTTKGSLGLVILLKIPE